MPYRVIRQRPAPRRRSPLPIILITVLVVYIGLSFLIVPTGTYKPTTTFANAASKTTQPVIAWPAYGQAAIGTKRTGLLASHSTQSSAPIASIAKIMTALSVLREKPLDIGEQGPILTLTQADVDIYNMYLAKDGSLALVAEGEQISEYQALQALLLPSANNMADTLAIWAFGSTEAYTVYANNYAKELGMSASVFSDASGFNPKTVSSASDLITLGQTALNNPVIAEIVAQRSATIPVAGTIYNVNTLLNSTQGFIGIKTGNTDQAGGCLLWAAKHEVDNQTFIIIGAIMGAPVRATALDDSAALLQSVRDDFTARSVVKKGTVVGAYNVPWGKQVTAVAADSIERVAWSGSDVTARVSLNDLSIPAKRGQTTGKLITTGSVTQPTESVAVTLGDNVSAPSWGWRLTHPLRVWQLRFGS